MLSDHRFGSVGGHAFALGLLACCPKSLIFIQIIEHTMVSYGFEHYFAFTFIATSLLVGLLGRFNFRFCRSRNSCLSRLFMHAE